MILVLGRLSRGVTFALLRAHMHEDRTLLGVAHILQDRHELVEVMAVDHADIVEAELLEQGAAGDEAAGELFRLQRPLFQEFGQPLGHLLADVAQRQESRARQQPGQVIRHGADRRRDRHLVVVEDDDQPPVARAGIVHGLVGHAGRHRAVADHGDDVVVAPRHVAGDRHAERGGDRGRGMRGAERVVLALGALGEAGQAAALTQRADAVAPPGEDLVRIGLVADVPDQLVVGRVEHVVQRHREFHDAEAGAEMAAGLGDGVDGLGTQFVGELAQLLGGKVLQIAGKADAIEQRGLGHV